MGDVKLIDTIKKNWLKQGKIIQSSWQIPNHINQKVTACLNFRFCSEKRLLQALNTINGPAEVAAIAAGSQQRIV